jgi:hypothetical protein
MGGSRFDANDWNSYSSATRNLSQAQVFTQKTASAYLDPTKVRESRDSAANPNSTPVIIFVDETGSMGILADTIIKKSLGEIVLGIYDHKPITDPHILVGGIGDAYTDKAPLQPSQFEAGVAELTSQIEQIYLEGNGGGNGGESYLLAWYFAANKTSIDSMIKRQKKGYLFTIGDEEPHFTLTKQQIKRIFGDDVEADMDAHELLAAASEFYEVFHLRVRPDSRYSKKPWTELMGERVIDVSDIAELGPIITSTMRLIEGEDRDNIIASHKSSASTALAVASATKDLVARKGGEVVTL